MKSKRDFQQAIAAEISNYPRAAELFRTQDPRLLAALDAMAAIFAVYSAEQDVAAAEPFTMARDATVLADAAAKGVLPFGLPTEVEALVENANGVAFNLATGRRVLDTQGRTFAVVAGVTVPANDSATVVLRQESERSFDHTVTVSQPFYQIEVPAPAEGKAIVKVRVLRDVGGTEFVWSPEYVNVLPGAEVFNLLSDADRRLLIEFGAEDLAGYNPTAGETFNIIITDTEGDITVAVGSTFAFEYSALPAEALVKMTMSEVTARGRGALDVPTLRTICKYPSIYDLSAVYLGNFDFLVRRNLSPFRFLSIWNEQTEETVRGPDVGNINTLFVAATKDGVLDSVLFDQIKAVILRADDSYKVQSVPFDEVEIPVEVVAKVHSVYDFAQVEQQIREQILAAYGRDSAFAKAGQNRVLYKSIYRLLERSVPALQGERADLEVEVTDTTGPILPEQYRFVSDASLTVTVEQVL